MCSSLLGLGGTHVQQCSECRISRICVPYSRIFKRNSIAASYQHHAGLQPANLVTYSPRSCSRSRKLFRSVRSLLVYAPAACTGAFFLTTFPFHPVFCIFSTVYDRTTVQTSYVSYVPYEIFQNFKFNMTYCTHFHARFLCPIYSTPLTSVAYRTRYFKFNMTPLAPWPPGPLAPWPPGPLALRPLDRWPPGP